MLLPTYNIDIFVYIFILFYILYKYVSICCLFLNIYIYDPENMSALLLLEYCSLYFDVVGIQYEIFLSIYVIRIAQHFIFYLEY